MAERALEGRIALVTGASRGIGAATAKAVAAAGAHVVLTARKARDLEAVEEAVHDAGGTATIAPMDLTESDSIARLATAVHQRWDKLDVLVINAAMLPPLTPVTLIEPLLISEPIRPGCTQMPAELLPSMVIDPPSLVIEPVNGSLPDTWMP